MRAINDQYVCDTLATQLGDEQRGGKSLREAIVTVAKRHGLSLDSTIDSAASGCDCRAGGPVARVATEIAFGDAARAALCRASRRQGAERGRSADLRLRRAVGGCVMLPPIGSRVAHENDIADPPVVGTITSQDGGLLSVMWDDGLEFRYAARYLRIVSAD